jgi:hypothetical protein
MATFASSGVKACFNKRISTPDFVGGKPLSNFHINVSVTHEKFGFWDPFQSPIKLSNW